MKVDQAKIRRYVLALFEVACQKNILDQMILDLESVLAKIRSNKNLRVYLNDPEESFSNKKKSLEAFFGDSLSKYTYNFLFILLKINALNALGFSYSFLKKLRQEKKNVLEAEVQTVVTLSDRIKNKIIEKLTKLTGKRIILETKINEQILGGLYLRVGDDLIDLTLSRQLENLKKKLLH